LLLWVPIRFPAFSGVSSLGRLTTSRVVRFGCVGIIVTLFFMGLNKALSLAFGLGAQAAFLASYPPALALHFGLNKWWTFGDRSTTTARHVGDYLFSVVATFFIQWPAFTLLHAGLHLRGWLAAGGANALQMAVSYLLMKKRVFRTDAPEDSGRGSWHRLTLLLCTVALSALLAWNSIGDWNLPALGERQYDYFNYLVSGFRKGSLALDVPVPPELIAVKNPYDPAQRPAGIAPHDVSYFHGKYYIYFGVVPVVTLFWPFRVVTGIDLSMTYATLAYELGAFWVAAWLWTRILRDHFPRTALLTKVAGLFAVGVVGGQLVVGRRTSFWEIPIEAGYFHLVVAGAAFYLSLSSRRRWLWLGLSGLSLGLAIGCRPTLVGAVPGFALIAAWTGWSRAAKAPGGSRLIGIGQCAAFMGIPLGAVIAGLLAYNAARFGDPLEFGIRYQLTSSADQTSTKRFSPSYVPFNFRTYFLSTPRWGRYFPFVHPSRNIKQPPGYYGIEFTYGALIVCPLVWICALFPGWIMVRRRLPVLPLASLFILVAFGTTGILLCFNSAAGRYVEDFLPWWLWAAVLSAAAFENEIRENGFGTMARGASWLFGACAAYSAAVEFFQSADIHGIFEFENPKAFVEVARAFDWPAALVEKATGQHLGALEMEVVFPEGPLRGAMPLVVTGVSYQTDFIFVSFPRPGCVRFGYLSSGGSPLWGDDFEFVAGKPYHLRIEDGSLYPPKGHPTFKEWTPAEIRSAKSWVVVAVDGRQVLKVCAITHDSTPSSVQIGQDRELGSVGLRFTGKITNVRRDELRRPAKGLDENGDVVLELTLPPGPDAQVQPLVVLGTTGQADLIGMRLPDPSHFDLFYESWGGGTAESGPIPVPSGGNAKLRFRMGAVFRGRTDPASVALADSIVVWMGDRPIWWTKERRELPSDPPLGIGVNSIESSVMIPYFKGRIDEWSRGRPVAWRAGPFAALELELCGRGVASEPLVAIGRNGKADVLAVRWLTGTGAQLVYDHWGAGELTSPPFAWEGLRPHLLRLEMPGFARLGAQPKEEPSEGALNATLDGRVLWSTRASAYASPSDEVYIGRNEVGSSIAVEHLSSLVTNVEQFGPESDRALR
jgi:putative flippase GtrA